MEIKKKKKLLKSINVITSSNITMKIEKHFEFVLKRDVTFSGQLMFFFIVVVTYPLIR